MAVDGLACLKFVKTSQETSQSMSTAIEAVEETGQLVKCVKAEEIDVASSTIKNSVYVLDTFDMPLYHSLSGKTRIIGPMVVLAHIKHNLPLPASRQPVFTMAMHGVTVCCTQTGARDKRERLMELVKLMSGRVTGNFTRHVTHLVAGQVGSTKYKVARSLGTPVLRPSWIEYCWEESRVNLIKGTSEDIVSSHHCSPLAGCVISSTGFSLEGRARLRELSEQNGAEYSCNLVRDTCTHLIVDDIKSKKYQYARDWKIYCVSDGWLHSSIKKGYCMEENDYPVPGMGGAEEKEAESNKNHTSKHDSIIKTEIGVNPRKRSAGDSNDGADEAIVKKKVKPLPTELSDSEEDDDLLSQYKNAMPALLFAGKHLSIHESIPDETKLAIVKETEKRGATIVPLSMPCDYHVSPLSLHSADAPPEHCKYVATLIWLERCLASNKLIEPSAHFLFQPLSVPVSNTTLEGCVITISQYDGQERENLSCFSKRLGATVQDCFVRYPTRNLLATTHLLLKEPHGEKYQSSLSWGVPAISERWLLACATNQRIVPVNDYLIKPCPQVEDTHVDEPIDHASSINMAKKPDESFHPDYDLNDISIMNVSHGTTTEGPNTQLAGMFQCNMDTALATVTHAEQQQQETDQGGILVGVVIVVHKKLSSLKGELHRLASALGGKWRPSYDSQCTHYIYQGKLSDASRDKQLQLAKNSGCVLVSYYWLLMCSQTGRREDEGLYPCNYDPNRVLPMLSQRVNGSTDKAIEEQENIDESNIQQEDNEDNVVIYQSDVTTPSSAVPSIGRGDSDVLKKQCDEILQMIERNKKQPTNKRGGASSPSSKSRSPDPKRRAPAKFNRRGGSPPDSKHVTDSQLMTVIYDNPDTVIQQEKLLEQIRNQDKRGVAIPPNPSTPVITSSITMRHLVTPSTVTMTTNVRLTRSMSKAESSVHTDITALPTTHLPIVTSNTKGPAIGESLFTDQQPNKETTKPKPVVLLSSLNIQEKADYGSLVQDLGGDYCESDHFLSSCTHLVVGKASRTEKYLAACASGKWILNRTYLEACRVESRFVEESEYEWGSHLVNSSKATPLDLAPRKWRLKVMETKKKAFEGWRVLLCVEAGKQNGLKRLLEAGNGVVIPSSRIKSEFTSNQITHAFLNPSVRDPQISLSNLVAGGVHCMRPDYIAEYLQRETPPTVEQFLLPEAVKLMRDLKYIY